MKRFTIATIKGESTANQSLWDLATEHTDYLDALDIDRASDLAIGDSFGGATYTIWRTEDSDE